MTEIQNQGGLYKRDQVVRSIINLLLKERRTEEMVLELLMDDEGPFQYKQSYAYELLREAKKYTAEVYAEYTVGMVELVVADLMQQRYEASKLKDSRLVFDITKEMNKVKGLYIEKHEVTHKVEQPLFNITPIDIEHIEIKNDDIEGLFNV